MANLEGSFVSPVSEPDMMGKPLSEHIEETEPMVIPEDTAGNFSPEDSGAGIADPNIIQVTAKEAARVYGAVMETAHTLVNIKNKDSKHRSIPEERRQAQGEILAEICNKYNIQLPEELTLLIFGGAMVADWQYMTDSDGKKKTNIKEQSEDQT
jgi:hypothetical protein